MTDWISVNERKPEAGQLVLCFGKYVDTESNYGGEIRPFIEEMQLFIGGCHYTNGEVYWYATPSDYPDDIDKVTHWMPLPNPPIEDQIVHISDKYIYTKTP